MPSKFDIYTGGKVQYPELTIYYNIAHRNIETFINHYEKIITETDSSNVETNFIKLDKLINNIKPSTYNYLAEFFWKANYNQKNKDGYTITENDKKLINTMICKLNEIRNFHAHICHNNEALLIDHTLKDFIMYKFNTAIAEVYKEHPKEVDEFEFNLKNDKKRVCDFFKNHNNNTFITREGRIFFLSFFLTEGQMSQLLQMSKGSKRNDTQIFRVKRLIYSYYCQRDGKALSNFNNQDSLINSFSNINGKDEKKDIMFARQTYKLITYLHDYPHYLANNETMPIFINNPQDTTLLKKVSSIQNLIEFINQHQMLKDFIFTPITVAGNNSTEEHELLKTAMCTYNKIPDYEFQISFDTLYQLTMLCMKYGEDTKIEIFKNNLIVIAENRRKLYKILSKNSKLLVENDDIEFVRNKDNQKLRGCRKLTVKGIMFFDDFEKKYSQEKKLIKGYENARVMLTNYIRPNNISWQKPPDRLLGSDKYQLHNPEPITIHTHDFVIKTEQKFRAGNRFIFYCVKYLIDHKITNWHWECEIFESAGNLVKIKEFQNEIKDGYRLCIDDDQITIGIPKTNITQLKDVNYFLENGKINYFKYREQFYQFRLGLRAFRYLIAFHILGNNNGNLNDFFEIALKAEMEKLEKNGWTNNSDFELLEEQFVPTYLKTVSSTADITDLIKSVKTRIESIVNDWDSKLANIKLLKRAEKNCIIMDAYRFFNWTIDVRNGQMKFFRKNEYNQMSVCHYSLHKKTKEGKNKSKYHSLFEDLFALNRRQPAIPAEILKLLNKANSLDELMQLTIEDRKKDLMSKFGTIAILPNNLKKKEVIPLCHKLGLSVPADFLTDENKSKLSLKHKHTFAMMPFLIHPVMLIKYFEPNEYKQNYAQLIKTPMQANSILKQFRTPEYTKNLHNQHYDIKPLERFINETNNPKQLKNWIGEINTTMAEDAMLWWIAKIYLGKNHYTKNMKSVLESNVQNELKVGNLSGSDILLPLSLSPVTNKNKDKNKEPETLYMVMKMHELDDVMFATEYNRLYNAALHYRHRHTIEKAHWVAYEENKLTRRKTKTIIEIPDGTNDKPIPYETLRSEMLLISNHARIFAGYLLKWEYDIIFNKTRNMSVEEKDNFLPIKYFDFEKVTKWTTLNDNIKGVIRKYRDYACHNGIPTEGSYSWKAKPGSELSKIMGITTPINEVKDTSRFIK